MEIRGPVSSKTHIHTNGKARKNLKLIELLKMGFTKTRAKKTLRSLKQGDSTIKKSLVDLKIGGKNGKTNIG
jgi:hypothetical protein